MLSIREIIMENLSKKDSFVTARRNLIDEQTGEIFESFSIIRNKNTDKNFKKVFLGELLDIIDEISTAKMKFLLWLLDNLDKTNKIYGTYADFAKASGISRVTIARVMPKLIESGAIKQITRNVFMFNSDLVTALNSEGRTSILIQYENL